MKNKIYFQMRIILCLFIILFYTNGCSFVKPNEEIVFKKRLYKFLNTPITSEEHKKILLNFSEEFPDSKYTDDAHYITFLLCPENRTCSELETLISKYPKGKLEESTIEYLEEIFGEWNLFPLSEFYISYDVILLYEKGREFLYKDRNENESIKYMLRFLAEIDETDPKMKAILDEVYPGLYFSYKNLDNKVEARKIKDTLLKLHTDNPKIKKNIESWWP